MAKCLMPKAKWPNAKHQTPNTKCQTPNAKMMAKPNGSNATWPNATSQCQHHVLSCPSAHSQVGGCEHAVLCDTQLAASLKELVDVLAQLERHRGLLVDATHSFRFQLVQPGQPAATQPQPHAIGR